MVDLNKGLQRGRLKQKPFRQISPYLDIFRHMQIYSGIIRHVQELFRHIQNNPGKFKTMVYSEPYDSLNYSEP